MPPRIVPVVPIDLNTYWYLSGFRKSYALYLVGLGYWLKVLVCLKPESWDCSCGGVYHQGHGRESCPTPGKHPPRTKKQTILRTAQDVEDLAKHRRWQKKPFPNVGVLMGVSSNPDWVPLALDWDLYKTYEGPDGVQVPVNPVQALERRLEVTPDWSCTVQSGSLGLHNVYQVPRTLFIYLDGSPGRIAFHPQVLNIPGLDVLFSVGGNNAYFVGPGSIKPPNGVGDGVYRPLTGYELRGFGSGGLPLLPDGLQRVLIESLARREAQKGSKTDYEDDQPNSSSTFAPERYAAALQVPFGVRWRWAVEWIQNGKHAHLSTNGARGHRKMVDAMRVLTLGFGFSPQEAWPLMLYWNQLRTRTLSVGERLWSEPELWSAALAVEQELERPRGFYAVCYYNRDYVTTKNKSPRPSVKKAAWEIDARLKKGACILSEEFKSMPRANRMKALSLLEERGNHIYRMRIGQHRSVYSYTPLLNQDRGRAA